MSSWLSRSIRGPPANNKPNYDPWVVYPQTSSFRLIDKSQFYRSQKDNIRMFNCAIIVKKPSGEFDTVISDVSDTILFMYRETPIDSIINSIYTIPMSIDTFKPYGTPQNIVRYAIKGYKEDARFFLYGDKIGISYTENFTMGISWLNNTNLERIKIPFRAVSKIEKNWTFFEKNGNLFAFRFYKPLVIYKIDLETNTLDKYQEYAWSHKIKCDVRGGAPPVRIDDEYYLFLHSAVTYRTYILTLDAYTLAPLKFGAVPILNNMKTKYQFVCGALFNSMNNQWILSLGIDDLYCAITNIDHSLLLSSLSDVELE